MKTQSLTLTPADLATLAYEQHVALTGYEPHDTIQAIQVLAARDQYVMGSDTVMWADVLCDADLRAELDYAW